MQGAGGKKMRILIAEDDTNIRNILQFTLEGRGYEVVAVGDGKAALEQSRAARPDLVILDVMMPHKNGLEVCYELKNDPKMEHVPVLIVTALTQTSTKSDDYWKTRSRADDFITKPFKTADLVKRVETLMMNARPEGEGRGRLRI